MMSDIVLEINDLTKDYGKNRGVFDITLSVTKGEVFGYVGTNGSGKTTTIRTLMGFIQADKGSSSVLGLDSWKDTVQIMKDVSYIPGEIAFPNFSTGTEFLKSQAEYLGVKDYTYMNHVIELLQLDPTANLKRMSKGMKQKTAIVAALMGEKDILILDEPTTGLDPLMRESFLELIREEKAKGHTIFMSSHIFEEIEEVCDKVAMIKDGRIIDIADLYDLRHSKTRKYAVIFQDEAEAKRFAKQSQAVTSIDGKTCEVVFPTVDIREFLGTLQAFSIQSITEHKTTLEDYFLKAYSYTNTKKGAK